MSEQTNQKDINILAESQNSKGNKQHKPYNNKYKKESASVPKKESNGDSQANPESSSTQSKFNPNRAKNHFGKYSHNNNNNQQQTVEMINIRDEKGNEVWIQKPFEEYIAVIDVSGNRVFIRKDSLPSSENEKSKIYDKAVKKEKNHDGTKVAKNATKSERTPEEKEKYIKEQQLYTDLVVQESLNQIKEFHLESINRDYELTGDVNRTIGLIFNDDIIKGEIKEWSRSEFFTKIPFQYMLINKFVEIFPFFWLKFEGKGKVPGSQIIRVVKNYKK
jgi:uncharacterized protein YrzB (UPF0473 family)